jgi:hypothetical protein
MLFTFAIKTGFCFLLAGCLCLGVGCASVKPEPKPMPVEVVTEASESAFVQWLIDWWNSPPPNLRPTSQDDRSNAELLGGLIELLGKAVCHNL